MDVKSLRIKYKSKRSAKEIQAEIRELKREMKERGIIVTSMMNRQPNMEAMRMNERLFALKVELEKAQTKEIDSDIVREFVTTQDVDPQYLHSTVILEELTRRFNKKHGSSLTVSEFRQMMGN